MEPPDPDSPSRLRRLIRQKRLPVTLRIALLFAALDGLNLWFLPEQAGFLGLALHPYWALVLLYAVQHGLAAGLTAGTLAAFHVVFFTLGGIPTKIALEQLAESGGLTLAVAFFLTGAVLGALRQRGLEKEREQARRLREANTQIDQLKQDWSAADRIRRVLEARIVGEAATVKTFYRVARRFETRDPAQVCEGCLEVLRRFFQVERVSLYLAEGSDLVLRAHLGWAPGEAAEGRVGRGETLMGLAFEQGRFLTPREMLEHEASGRFLGETARTVALVPLRNGRDEPIGVVNIERIEFAALTRPNLELMQMVADWAGRALERIERIRQLEAERFLDETLDTYAWAHFERTLPLEVEKARVHGVPLTVGLAKIERFGFLEEPARRALSGAAVSLLKKHLSATDLVFRYRFDGTFAVLAPLKAPQTVEPALKAAAEDFERLTGSGTDGGVSHPAVRLTVGCSGWSDGMRRPEDLLGPLLERCKFPVG